MGTSNKFVSSLDLRSIVIGVAGVILLLLVAGQSSSLDNGGRYTITPAGSAPFGVFVLDTHTGDIWRMDDASTIYYGTPKRREFPESNEPRAKRRY